MNKLRDLLKLQEIDHDIRAGKQRLHEVLQAQKSNEELEEAQERRARSQEALQEAQRQQKALEFELNQVTSKRRRSSDRLYSGKVTNPKELEDLQLEVESLERRRNELEDELLEAMLVTESAQEEDDDTAAVVEELEAQWAQKKSRLAGEQDQLATKLNELLATRQQQASRIDQQMRAAYESTRQKRGGVGVAVVLGGLCQSCGVRVSSSKVSAAQAGKLVRCGSCDRILVVP